MAGGAYDYNSALSSLQAAFDRLTAHEASQRPRSALAQLATFWKRNWVNVFLLFSMYSMTSISMFSNVYARKQLAIQQQKVSDLQHEKEERQLQLSETKEQLEKERDQLYKELVKARWGFLTKTMRDTLLGTLEKSNVGDDMGTTAHATADPHAHEKGSFVIA